MAFQRDVAFMHEVEPGLMRLNGEELARVAGLLEAVLPTLARVQGTVEWEDGSTDLFRARMKDAENLAQGLRAGFGMATTALLEYAEKLGAAKQEMQHGDAANDELRALIKEIADTQSKWVRDSEPLSQWEDLRKITGWFDRQAEQDFQDQINSVRPRAEELYYEAARAYSRVRQIEADARGKFIAEMRQAFQRLPDFKADSNAAENIIKTVPDVIPEMFEAGVLNRRSRLPGQGSVAPFGIDAPDGLSDTHEDIRQRTQNLSYPVPDEWNFVDAVDGKYIDPEHEQEYKKAWIRANQELIQAAALEYGIPAELLAGIIYQEAGGKPPVGDHVADWVRRHNPFGGKDPDDTSFGLMGIQVDTAATALGYDPAHLTDKQRREIINSLDDPKQSIVIAAKVLSDAKDATDFRGIDPKDMSEEQMHELAARYNGGPGFWNKSVAQGYADNYDSARHDVNQVLYGN